jgi:cardiolipin synthase C
MNLDERSVRLNTEMGLIIESEPLASIVANRFKALTVPENAYNVALTPSDALVWRTHEQGSVVEFRKEPARSGWQRFELHCLELLPLDREL